jgi:ATP-dependent NAD(P)H-hydrate dehydratase
MAGSGAVIEWIPRLDALLIGPGLGRDRAVIQAACHTIIAAAARGLPLLLDADGLFILTSALRPGGHVPAPLAAQVAPRGAACAPPSRVDALRDQGSWMLG